MRMLANKAVSAGNRHAQADLANHWQVGQIVAQKGNLVHFYGYDFAQLAERGELVSDSGKSPMCRSALC